MEKGRRDESKPGELTCFRGERNVLGMIGLDGVHPSVLRADAAGAADTGRLSKARGQATGPGCRSARLHVLLGAARRSHGASDPGRAQRSAQRSHPRLLDR